MLVPAAHSTGGCVGEGFAGMVADARCWPMRGKLDEQLRSAMRGAALEPRGRVLSALTAATPLRPRGGRHLLCAGRELLETHDAITVRVEIGLALIKGPLAASYRCDP